jgi:uncharacterized integral membrane protein
MSTSETSPMGTPADDEGGGPDAAAAPDLAVDGGGSDAESRRARVARQGRRARLYATAFVFVALLVILVALAAANDRSVKLDWVAGSTQASLVWVIVIATLVGWLLGMIMSALFRFRTRDRH